MSIGPITDAQAQRFGSLAWPLLPVVLRTAHCLVRSSDQAEDLAQEAMVKAMRAIDTYQDGTDIRAWLLTILRRTHIDRLRAARSRPESLPLDETVHAHATADDAAGVLDEPWDEPEELLNRFEDDAVIDALHKLPDDMRWTLLLVDVEQLDHREAAAVLDVAVGTIKSRASRARAMLRDHLHPLAVKRGWIGAKEQSS